VTLRTSPTLPTDHHGTDTARHSSAAQAMRDTGEWVHVSTYKTRKGAAQAASDARTGRIKAYRGGVYDVRAITTSEGEHQVWGRYVEERRPQ